jgi:hypothetical protein
MITSQDEEVFGIFDLVCEEKANRLERLFTPINIVAKEEVVGFWRESSVFEKTQKVVVLAVDITY